MSRPPKEGLDYFPHDTDAYTDEKIEILINNAFDFSKDTGFNDDSVKIENMSKEKFMRGIESGIYWAFLSTQIIGEKMKK